MPSFRRTTLAWTLVIVGCGGGAVAQMALERASATVAKTAPAKLDFDPSFASRLQVPAGFAVTVFASGLQNPRMMDVAPDGTVYVTRRDQDDVLALRDTNGDGAADEVRTFAANLDGVHGIAITGDDLLLASSTMIWRTPRAAAAPRAIVTGLPDGGQHPNRMVRVGPDGQLYVSVGSSCNDCAEANQLERATMIRYAPDGSTREVVANGLRNTIGYDWHPQTRALWGMDHGSDFRGDDVPPEELNLIRAGANYGWPICYADRVVDPMTNAQPKMMALAPGQSQPSGQPLGRAEYCARTEPSVATTTAHSAPMAMRFVQGTQFPAALRNDAFVAMRGSWNRAAPVGYKVVRVRFTADGRAAGFEDFVTGFLTADGTAYLGRPVGIAFAADGALLVSDDQNGVIYRVAYRGG